MKQSKLVCIRIDERLKLFENQLVEVSNTEVEIEVKIARIILFLKKQKTE